MPPHYPVSNAKSLEKIRPRKQNRDRAASNIRKIVGIDTETDGEGNIFLIADSDGRFLELADITFEKVAHWLMRYDERYWLFFYNLGLDAGVNVRPYMEKVSGR